MAFDGSVQSSSIIYIAIISTGYPNFILLSCYILSFDDERRLKTGMVAILRYGFLDRMAHLGYTKLFVLDESSGCAIHVRERNGFPVDEEREGRKLSCI